MDDNPKDPGDSSGDVEELRRRLAEAEGTLDAIRRGMVDAFVVEDGQGEKVYTLKGAEKAYNVFIETINEGLVALDSSNNILYSNTAFAHLVGSSPDRASGSSAHRFIQEEDRPLFDRLVAQSIGGKTSRREFSILTETGELAPMLLSFSNLEIAGINGACMVLTDLTEQKRAARDLQEQYSVLSGILESSNSPIFSIDADYLYSSFNNAHAAVMKALYEADIELGRSILAYMTVEKDRIEAKRNLDRALRGGQFVETEYSGDEGRSRKYFEVSYNPIRNKRGEVTGVAVFAIDQTDRKQAEDALRKSEEHFRLLFDNAGEAIISHDSELIMTDVNRLGCELIGYSREELVGKNILELGILHPDDIENAAKTIRRHFDGEDITEAEYTFIRKDGAERLSTVTSASIRDPDGGLQSITIICRDVTEERRVVGALMESERSLKIAQEMGLIGSWEFDIESQEITWSDETYVLYDRDPALGPPTAEEEAGYYSDDQSSMLREYARRAIEEKRDFKYDLEARIPTGRCVLYTGTMHPVKDEGGRVVKLFGTVQDITERKRAEEELRLKESAISTSINGIAIADMERRLTYTNRAFLNLHGYESPDEVLGREIVEFVEGERELAPVMSELLEKGSWMGGVKARKKDGSLFDGQFTTSVIVDDEGNPVAMLATMLDITERKRAEELIKKNSEELKELIEIAAHELRHPAAVFRGYAQILMANWEDLDRETIQDALSSIDAATNRLMRLVNSLLETSRIERGKIGLSLSEVDPVAPARQAIEEFRSRESDRELRLNCAALDKEIMDAEKVKQVLVILIDNAVKYSDKECPIDIECVKVEGEIVYRVADLGPGILDEDRESIFERFYQGGDVLHHSLPGIGLGLYIAKVMVEVHGGWISEEPRDGGGSVFSFGIPCRSGSDHVQIGSYVGVAR